ncbi:MAG: hypothetical protein P4L63_01245 [Candidatus Pacebacteria bacterium]|nr:hypothetical protein [Candidatus Paceibacterota bacterium]
MGNAAGDIFLYLRCSKCDTKLVIPHNSVKTGIYCTGRDIQMASKQKMLTAKVTDDFATFMLAIGMPNSQQ